MDTIKIWTKEKGYQSLSRTQENLDLIDEQDYLRFSACMDRSITIPLQTFLPQYLLGIDVSKWQGIMNWEKALVNGGAKFALIRAGFAGSSPGIYEDSQFERNSNLAPLYLPTGFYWFFRPTTDPIIQANFFCNLIKEKAWEIRPVIDVEVADNVTPHNLRIAIESFVKRVEYHLNVKPQIVYTRTTFWNPYVEDSDFWETLDLFIARYDETLTHPWGDNQFKPRDWNDWRFWQFSCKGDGSAFGAESMSIDLDYFNGLEEDFEEYIEGEVPPPPAPTIVETYQLKVLANVLNIRNAPNVNGTLKGVLYKDNLPCEFEEIKNANGSIWSRIGWKQYACKRTNTGIIYMEYI